MRFFVGADHAGFKLKEEVKEFLKLWRFQFEDLSPKYDDGDDYPDHALKVAEKVVKTGERGILICGSGEGMTIAANKVPGIRAALCTSEDEAALSREHNDSNILVLDGWHTSKARAKKILTEWIKAPFEGGRHQRRLDKIRAIEKKYYR